MGLLLGHWLRGCADRDAMRLCVWKAGTDCSIIRGVTKLPDVKEKTCARTPTIQQ